MFRRVLSSAILSAVVSTAGIAAPPKTLVLEKIEVPDSKGKIVASTLYQPKGWTCDMEAKWYPNWHHQACLEGSVSDPNSLERYQALQWSRCIHATGMVGGWSPPQLSNYLGSLYLEPMKPSELFETTFMKHGFKNLNAKIVEHKEMPEVAAMFIKSTGIKNILANKTRITYKIGRDEVEEDIYLICDYNVTDTAGGGKLTLCGPTVPPFALRAAKGKLDDATPKLLSIVHSHKVTEAYIHGVVNGFQKMSNDFYDNIAVIDRVSKQVSANNDAMISSIRNERTTRWANEDRASKKFSDYILGVDAVTDGRNTYTVPVGYSNSWSDGSTIILSNDTNYDPNQTERGTWNPLKPTK
jgi:hypothetical protein